MKPGPRNLITDVAGLAVGNAQDPHIKTGTTVLTADRAFGACVDVMGGAPGTRETDLLDPDRIVTEVHALVLSGGSAFGLDAPSGVADVMRTQGRGYEVVGDIVVPIVPGAILFDLSNGGDKGWDENPYKRLGAMAYQAAGPDFELGTAGAGFGATSANLKGGLGSASVVLDSGHTVGALVAANPVGSVVAPDMGNFWAGAFEVDDEFGGLGAPTGIDPLREPGNEKVDTFNAAHDAAAAQSNIARANTTIAIVATDAALDQAQLKRLAVSAQDGMARAIVPAHTPFDGDLIFSVSTGALPVDGEARDLMAIGHAASLCLSRAISRAIYLATSAPTDVFPTWQSKWGDLS